MSISTNNAGSSVVGCDRPLTEGKLATIINAKHADQNATSAKEVCAAGMTVRRRQ